MKKLIAALLMLSGPAFAQSTPNWALHYQPPPAEWNALWASKQNYNAPGLFTSLNATAGATLNSSIIGGNSTTVQAPVTSPGTMSITVCPAGNCPALTGFGGGVGNPVMTSSLLQGITTRGSTQAEWLGVDSLFSNTGNPNGQKVARYIGAVQAPGSGAVWSLNTLTLRGGTTFAGAPGSGAGAIGTANSTIGYELDLTNWDQDCNVGTCFVVGQFINTLSSYTSTAGIYYGAGAGQAVPSWHNGIMFSGNTVADNTIYDASSSTFSYQVSGTHTVAVYDNSTAQYGVQVNGTHSVADFWASDDAPDVLKINGTHTHAVTVPGTITGTAWNGAFSATSINSTPIGATTPSTGAFTALTGAISAIGGTTYTVGAGDYALNITPSGAHTITLPSAASSSGRLLMLRLLANFTVSSASSNVIPQAGGSAGTAILAATAGKFVLLQSNGVNWHTMMSN